jgi:hypothetical protein
MEEEAGEEEAVLGGGSVEVVCGRLHKASSVCTRIYTCLPRRRRREERRAAEPIRSGEASEKKRGSGTYRCQARDRMVGVCRRNPLSFLSLTHRIIPVTAVLRVRGCNMHMP